MPRPSVARVIATRRPSGTVHPLCLRRPGRSCPSPQLELWFSHFLFIFFFLPTPRTKLERLAFAGPIRELLAMDPKSTTPEAHPPPWLPPRPLLRKPPRTSHRESRIPWKRVPRAPKIHLAIEIPPPTTVSSVQQLKSNVRPRFCSCSPRSFTFVKFPRTFSTMPPWPPWPHAANHVRPLLVEYIT